MQSTMNLKIKFRESFRPFAPIVLDEDAAEYFTLRQPSPYMLLVAPVAPRHRRAAEVPEGVNGLERLKVARSTIPAVTHVDFSARLQTVSEHDDARLHRLLRDFKALTGTGVLVNTPFNVRGEPIVANPHDAYRCFMRTNIDTLVMGEFLLDKDAQPTWTEQGDWRDEIPLD